MKHTKEIFQRGCIIPILIVLLSNLSYSQAVNFSVKKTSFSSSVNDEFSPVYYRNGLVYCSNALSNMSIKSDNERLFNLLYVQEKDSGTWKGVELFSKELTTILNEGPASFKADGNTVYFARNNIIEGKFKDINDPSNTIGIYSAEFKEGVWVNIKPFKYNSSEYSVGTPALSPDGLRMFFASDMPGGYGGTDIYYSDFVLGSWQKPINMGELVNTKGNESYPFLSVAGLLFFSSDGHGGFGGKDIYYTASTEGIWQKPIHLGANINSEKDDFGLITDINFEQGYFSTNRKHSQDIYSFKSELPQFGYCDTLFFQPQCYEFFDERFTDTLHLKHEWNFGNGIIQKGYAVKHCFNSPGDYEVVLTIQYKLADSVFSTKAIHRFTIENTNSVYIQSSTLGVVDEEMSFQTLLDKSNDFEPKEVYWNFSGGYNSIGKEAKYTYSAPGNYIVTLGLSGDKDNYGRIPRRCYSKEIEILSDYQEMAIRTNREQCQQILLDKDEVLKLNTAAKNNIDSYRIDRYMIASSINGIENDKVDRSFLDLTNSYIQWKETEFTLASIELIDKIAGILNEHRSIKLLIAVHSSNKGNSKANLSNTIIRAARLTEMLKKRGVDTNQIESIGYGDTRPLINNREDNARFINQRIELIVLDNNAN